MGLEFAAIPHKAATFAAHLASAANSWVGAGRTNRREGVIEQRTLYGLWNNPGLLNTLLRRVCGSALLVHLCRPHYKKEHPNWILFEATTRFELVIRLLQSLALPLGHVAM
jgi:hypothetical protein